MFSQQVQRLVSRLVWSQLARRLALVAVLVTSLVAGFLGGWAQTVQAQACGLHAACPFGDTTRTSSLTVAHRDTSNQAVEPNIGTTLQITARYTLQTNGTTCDCADRTVQATVGVDWTGSGWNATCTSGCGGAIVQVGVCDASACGPTVSPVRAYELIVDLAANAGFLCFGVPQPGKLFDVTYETTSIDDGFPIVNATTCDLGSAVSPTSQFFTQTDSGTFECAYTCADASGPTMTITYE